MQSKVPALQSCPRVLSSSEFVVGLIAAPWSEGAGACFAPGVTCLCSHCSCLNCINAVSFLQKTRYWSQGPTLSLQALRPSLSSCSFAARDCGSAGRTWASACTLLLAVLGCVRVRGQPEALICFAGFRGMCLTSLSRGDSPTCPLTPSWRWCPSPGAARGPRTW